MTRWNRRVLSIVIVMGVAAALLLGIARSSNAQQAAGKTAPASQATPQRDRGEPDGFSDTPILPGQKWRAHDITRPRPRPITPGAQPGLPPSDAVVLFDGKDLSQWASQGRGADRGKLVDPLWKAENGYFETVPKTGSLITKEKFGDGQYHVEWMVPTTVAGKSQDRGNSGFLIMNRYEIQVLDSYDNVTYADGGAGSLYGQWPPLVNASRKQGEWQTFDIAFEAPRFDADGKLVKPAYATIFYNGVLIHNHQEIMGTMVYRRAATYTRHGLEEPISLQDHGHPVRFRNIWVRRLRPYDEP